MSRFSISAALGGVILALMALLAIGLWQGPQGVIGALFLPKIGGPFRLVDQQGNVVTAADLRGKWLLVYFGYTRCEDECPTALNTIALALEKLGPERNAIRPVFITVDPGHDTPPVLRAYVKKFAAPILALTGSAAEVAQAAKNYRVYYAPTEKAGGSFEMNHSTMIYLMDRRGRFVTSFTDGTKPAELAERLKDLVR